MTVPQEDPVLLSVSKGLCRECGRLVPTRYEAEDDRVYLRRRCPDHGVARALVAESLPWLLDASSFPVAARPPEWRTDGAEECPTACGPCRMHSQACNLPVISVTNACDLRCPICFTYNRADRVWHMDAAEFERHLEFVVEATGGVDLVNVTGGEPTMHPGLLDLLSLARRPGIGRVTVNTNGLRLSREPDLAGSLSELGVYVVLSLDTLDSGRSVNIHGRDITGEKQRAFEALAEHEVDTTILMVLVPGVNEEDLEPVLELFLTRDHVRSLTIQTMTYTGQGGGGFLPRRHIPVDGVTRRIEEAAGGRIRQGHFFPLPTAHPLCYAVAYLLAGKEGRVRSLTDLLPPRKLARHLADGYLLRPGPELEADLRAAIDQLWADGADPELLAELRALLGRIYPVGEALSVAARQRRAEHAVKTIYVHAHMDEDTFETGRVMRCPDQVPVDAERLVSACCYNLFHRQRDSRFWVKS